MMKLKQHWEKMPYWLNGGLVGISICIALFFFYILAYFPLVQNETGIPNNALILPMVTGHAFPILSHFIVPYGFLCEFSEEHCTAWSSYQAISKQDSDCLKPMVMEGVEGCCTTLTPQPTSFCASLSEGVGFFGLGVLLLGIYFGIGAAVGKIIQKWKFNK
ncbi:hypothetical protein HYU19_02605 [Candidatus Woesearchaeota archaeon]|nr:hypothetical protein [Candidatus Woesearchaeota archaeon]